MNETTNKTLVQEILWLKDRIKALEDEKASLQLKWDECRHTAVDLMHEMHANEMKKDY